MEAAREALERETMTAPGLDATFARIEGGLQRLPAEEPAAPVEEPIVDRHWQLGERARSRSGGWEGRIAALERGGKRATLEAGGMRVTVDTDDLVAALGEAANEPATGPGSAGADLRLERARTVASSLDLRGARVDEALEALHRYLDDAGLAGLDKVIVIHGMGTGAVRDAVRSAAGGHPLVKSLRPGQRGEGGDGATIVEF